MSKRVIRPARVPLHEAEIAYREARDRAAVLRVVRDVAMRDALAEGWTQANIARETGLTRARVNQIVGNG